MKILVTGNRGVIGKVLASELEALGHTVIRTTRTIPTNESEIQLKPWQAIDPELQVDFIVHVAGKYLVENSLPSQQEVFDASTGLATVISNFAALSKTPLIALGSYFEKSLPELSPWSYYAIAKIASRDLMRLASIAHGIDFTYLYLYDTYSEDLSRGKFIDLLLTKSSSIQSLELSPGKQVQNLTNVKDVVKGIIQILELPRSSPNSREFQIRSTCELSLREIAEKVNSHRNVKFNFIWGAKEYRPKEVFKIWDSAPTFPDWIQSGTFEEFLVDYFEGTNNDK
jgi:nucleoside-diphosphate-sugar epimerase